MDFARQQRDPTRHAIGIGFVVLVHALVIWALMSGLGKTMIEVIKKPLNATIIEEIKLPPPPPPPPPKKIEVAKAPPPEQPYVPPPDIPPPVAPTESVIAAPSITPPPEPHVIAPPPPPEAPPAPKPAIRRGLVPIDKVDPIFPKKAIRDGIESGKVLARLQVDEKGLVTEVKIVEAKPPRVFDAEVIRALSQWKFKPEGDKYIAEVEVNFVLQ